MPSHLPKRPKLEPRACGMSGGRAGASSSYPSYCKVRISMVRDQQNDIARRDPEEDNQTGDGTHDPEQFGTVFVSIEGMDGVCPEYPDGDVNYVQTRGNLVDVDQGHPEHEWGYPEFLHSWNDTLVDGFPTEIRDPDWTNEDAAYKYDQVFAVPWDGIDLVPWTGQISQLDYALDPWQSYYLVIRWLKAALFDGVAPQKEPGKRRTPPPPPAPRREDSDDEPLGRRAIRFLGL